MKPFRLFPNTRPPMVQQEPQATPAAYWSLSSEQLLSALRSTSSGLQQADAESRLKQYGLNALKVQRRATAFGLFLNQFKSPLVLILIFAAIVSAFVGEWTDAVIVLAVVFGSTILGFAQEYSASNADLERAAIGILRSAFGLQGQKCSAASRIYIEEPVYDDLTARLKELAGKLTIGDPTERQVYFGPVINKNSFNDFKHFTEEISQSGGKFLAGGHFLSGKPYDKGYFCEPTFVTDLPLNHRLWKHEMFLPITTIAKVKNLEEAMKYANGVDYGLTAGFYGSEEEVEWFFDNIRSGVSYANCPQGATTGAWPGFQPFGGWKASGSSGKNAGGHYYLSLYMHEQIHTLVK